MEKYYVLVWQRVKLPNRPGYTHLDRHFTVWAESAKDAEQAFYNAGYSGHIVAEGN